MECHLGRVPRTRQYKPPAISLNADDSGKHKGRVSDEFDLAEHPDLTGRTNRDVTDRQASSG